MPHLSVDDIYNEITFMHFKSDYTDKIHDLLSYLYNSRKIDQIQIRYKTKTEQPDSTL